MPPNYTQTKKIKKTKNQKHKNATNEVVGDYTMAASRKNDAPGNIRAGRNVIGGRRNVIDDEAEELHAAEIDRNTVRIIVKKINKILCVFDSSNVKYIGMPGGVIEAGETPIEAAARELWEETGLIADDLIEIRTDNFQGNSVTLFIAKNPEGKLRGSHEGKVGWVDPLVLLKGQWGKYYVKIFKELGWL